jgi:hypothetical protein
MIPQVLAITTVARDGKVSVRKAVKQHLGSDLLYVDVQDEIRLVGESSATTQTVTVRGTRIVLPSDVLRILELSPGELLAFASRPDSTVALKRMTVEEKPGDFPHVADVETTHAMVRIAYTNPMPDVLLPQLQARHADIHLRYDVRSFLQGRESFPAWQARKLLDCADAGDDALRERFIEERLAQQSDDGSWDGNVLLTARNLRELADLGLTRDDAPIQRTVEWLVARPQSEHNPGQWFAADDLVEEQAQVVVSRQAGKGGRFRKVLTSEKKRVISGDELIQKPCGPRIMWPNGLVIEALLKLGYEDHGRVQTALRTLTTNEWCECGYQHGLSDWRRKEPLTEDQLPAFEQACVAQYRHGGFDDLKWLTGPDAPSRVAHTAKLDGDVYALAMPNHVQGCEFITTRSLSTVQHPVARRFAEAHLWRFAGLQRAGGRFPNESYGTGFSLIGILEAVARYDHPASRVILMRALPWIVEAQNADGSWGKGARKDVETLAVIRVLSSMPVSLL